MRGSTIPGCGLLVQSLAWIDADPQRGNWQGPPSWRVTRFLGFAGPANPLDDEAHARLYPPKPAAMPDPDILVIDDAGNGFRSAEQRWPAWLQPDTPMAVRTLILKTNTPLPPARIGRASRSGDDCGRVRRAGGWLW